MDVRNKICLFICQPCLLIFQQIFIVPVFFKKRAQVRKIHYRCVKKRLGLGKLYEYYRILIMISSKFRSTFYTMQALLSPLLKYCLPCRVNNLKVSIECYKLTGHEYYLPYRQHLPKLTYRPE